MFLVATVFLLVLGLSFAVVMLLTRPSTAERVIEGRIAKLSSPAGREQAPPEELVQIIKQRRLSGCALAGRFAAKPAPGATNRPVDRAGRKLLERRRRTGKLRSAGHPRRCCRLLRN